MEQNYQPKSTWAKLKLLQDQGLRIDKTSELPRLPKFIEKWEQDWFDEKYINEMFQKYWHYSIYIGIFYLISIFAFQNYMKTRPAFDLRKPLIMWSACLAVFSIIGAYRFIFAFKMLYQNHGFMGSICATYYYSSLPEGPWVTLFVLSKIPELIDTYFIIARKKKLIFLHWYHHTTVMMYSFYLARDRLAGGAYYGAMNFCIHAVMYTYYTFAACKIKMPKFINVFITSIQTMQMFVGVFVTIILWFQLKNPECPIHKYNLLAGSLMYSTYLYLFCQFFYKSYCSKFAKINKKD